MNMTGDEAICFRLACLSVTVIASVIMAFTSGLVMLIALIIFAISLLINLSLYASGRFYVYLEASQGAKKTWQNCHLCLAFCFFAGGIYMSIKTSGFTLLKISDQAIIALLIGLVLSVFFLTKMHSYPE